MRRTRPIRPTVAVIALAALLAAAGAVWAIAAGDDEHGAEVREPSSTEPARAARAKSKTDRPKAIHFTPFFTAIRPYVAGVEEGLCHVETPMGPGRPSTYPIFNTPTELATAIHRSGWDACSTASNHSVDQGQAGIDGTVKALHRHHVRHTGSFRSRAASRRPTILRVHGVKLGFVAYTDALNGLRPPHPWSVNLYSAADPKAGAKAIIP